jgi:flagellar protein FlaJ
MKLSDIFNNFLNRSRFRKNDLPEEFINEYERSERDIFEKIEYQRRHRVGLARLKKHPFKVLTERPMNILIISLPLAFFIFVAGFFFLVTAYGYSVLFSTTLLDDVIVAAIFIAIVPLAVLDFREGRRINSLETALPNFFRDVAGMNESGMTLPNAVNIVAKGEYGTLTPFIRKLNNELSWNVPFIEAVYRFGTRLGTPLAERSVDLIAKASKAGGDVSEVLRAAAKDSFEYINLSTERRNNMLIYVIIVVMSFFVFLFVIGVLTSTFLSTMAEAGAAVTASSGAIATGAFGSGVDMFFYTRLFSHAGMIQAFFSGLVAGQMGEGRAMAGLKYSAVMLLVAWIAFRFFI